MIIKIIFWVSVLALLHSYLIYPLILKLLSAKRPISLDSYKKDDELPKVSIILAVRNEETVIREKLESIFHTSYPIHKVECLIGSDASTDLTDKIIQDFSRKNKGQLFLFPFTERKGKPNIINELSNKATGKILVINDANVLFEQETLFELVKYFKTPDVGLVDSNMLNRGMKKEGISYQEKAYITREVKIKNMEGMAWGTMMGPFGGCYAIWKDLYPRVPEKYLVDDFYINMKILEKGKKCINNLKAKVYEDVSNDLREEFRRKARISAGNYQNLKAFRKLLWPPFSGIAFSFFSHKVLRWGGPFFILAALISNAFILSSSMFYQLSFIGQLALLLLPVIDSILRKIHLHVLLLRFITHFYSMNLALLFGFFKYIKGVKTNVWEPTRRNQ